MDNNTINQQGKRYVFSTEELIDVVKKNFDEIITLELCLKLLILNERMK